MDWFFSFIISCLFDIVIIVIGCSVARLAIPLLSFGRAYVEPPDSPPQPFNSLGCRRDQTGRIVVHETAAGSIGIIIVVLATVWLGL
jgi:hypothetical protein